MGSRSRGGYKQPENSPAGRLEAERRLAEPDRDALPVILRRKPRWMEGPPETPRPPKKQTVERPPPRPSKKRRKRRRKRGGNR